MYAGEESDCAVVPMKLPNKRACASAEVVEGRARTKENVAELYTSPTQSGEVVSQGFRGVREVDIRFAAIAKAGARGLAPGEAFFSRAWG